MKRINIACFLVCVDIANAFAYGTADVAGAWAYADNPNQACVVVTNETVWTLNNGNWLPTFRISPLNGGISFQSLLPDDDGQVILGHPEKWQIAALEKKGQNPGLSPNDIFMADMRRDYRREEISNPHRMTMAPMPDFSKVLDQAKYVGCWKPLKFYDVSGDIEVQSGYEVENKMLLSIRKDMKAILWYRHHKPSKHNPEPYQILELLPIEGWLRVYQREENKRHKDPLNRLKRAFWINPEGHLLLIHDDSEIIEFVRTDEAFEDPLDARAMMLKDKKLHGVWGVNHEFNIFVLQFDESGKGILTGFMGMLPFGWEIGDDGVIECHPDADLFLVQGGDESGFPNPLRCMYDPVKNEMTVLDIANGNTGKPRILKFMSHDVHVRDNLERLEKIKESPQWMHQLERAKQKTNSQDGRQYP